MIDPGAKILAGKTAVITGAGKNIGQRIAEHLAAVGANIVVNGRFDQAAVDETAAMLEQTYGIQALPFLADVTDRAAVDAMVEAAMEKFGRIDIAVSNAAHRKQTPFLDMSFDEWKGVISVALDGAFNVCQSCAKHMVANGEGGAIVTLSGISNRVGTLNRIHVNAAKAGLEGFTRGLAREMAPHGINVNAIAPGVVDGEHWDGVDAFFAKLENKKPGVKKEEVGQSVPYGRMGTPEDLSGMAVFLASPEAEYIVAQTYNVDGGNWMS